MKKTHILRGEATPPRSWTLCRINTDRISDRPTCERCRTRNKKRGWRDFTRHMWSLKMEQGGGDHGLVRAIQEAGDRMIAELRDSWWQGGD